LDEPASPTLPPTIADPPPPPQFTQAKAPQLEPSPAPKPTAPAAATPFDPKQYLTKTKGEIEAAIKELSERVNMATRQLEQDREALDRLKVLHQALTTPISPTAPTTNSGVTEGQPQPIPAGQPALMDAVAPASAVGLASSGPQPGNAPLPSTTVLPTPQPFEGAAGAGVSVDGPAPAGPPSKPSGPKQVGPGDLITVEVLQALPGRPISGERRVRSDGTISLGFYGDLEVAGLTRSEIKARLVEHLRKYLTDEALGLVEERPSAKDPSVREKVKIEPKDSTCVFVDDSPDASTAPATRMADLERKLDRLMRELEGLKRTEAR
jgi:hypothetical protein